MDLQITQSPDGAQFSESPGELVTQLRNANDRKNTLFNELTIGEWLLSVISGGYNNIFQNILLSVISVGYNNIFQNIY